MKISVVTAVYNRAHSIRDAIESVSHQDADLEYVVVDGMSTDGTAKIVSEYSDLVSKSIREPDEGIYDALNKGIEASTGDVVGFLHADDLFACHDAISAVQNCFESQKVDAVYGDLCYVKSKDTNSVVRYWKAGDYNVRKFRFGWMPPHPTVYVRREIYEEFGAYRTDVGSAADYECLLRLMVKNEIRVGYIPKTLVNMRLGGASNASLANRIAANKSDQLAWASNDLRPPLGLRFLKPLSKLSQYFQKPPKDN